MNPHPDFPRLTPNNHRDTSPRDARYNCIAWAAEDTEHWWQPGRYWQPADWPLDETGIGALEAAFRTLGYESCEHDTTEPGFNKVAFYAAAGYSYFTHAARQLPSGKWTSKLGKSIDIEHDTPDAVAGGVYGELVQFMKRADKATA